MPTVDETGRWDAPAVSSAEQLSPRLAALRMLAECAHAEYSRLARETAAAARQAREAIGEPSAGSLFALAKARTAISRAAELEWRRAERAFEARKREERLEARRRGLR